MRTLLTLASLAALALLAGAASAPLDAHDAGEGGLEVAPDRGPRDVPFRCPICGGDTGDLELLLAVQRRMLVIAALRR